MLFFKAIGSEPDCVLSYLQTYEVMSGQTINFSKSPIMFSRNIVSGCRDFVANILSVPQAPNIGRYLGFPMGIGRNRQKVFFSFIEHKLPQRIGGVKR